MRSLYSRPLAPREPQAEPTDPWRIRSATHLEALRGVAEAMASVVARWQQVTTPSGDGTPLRVLGSALDGLAAVERVDIPGAPEVPERERRALHQIADCGKRMAHQVQALLRAPRWERPRWKGHLDETLLEIEAALADLAEAAERRRLNAEGYEP